MLSTISYPDPALREEKTQRRDMWLRSCDIHAHKCMHSNYCLFHLRTMLSLKCKNIFTKMLKDVGMEVPKSIETRSKFSMHADKGRG